MAAIDQAWIDGMRERIKAKDIIDKLQACVDGTRELSKEQIASAKILLGKVIPDLKAVEHKAEGGGPLKHHHTVEFVNGAPATTI